MRSVLSIIFASTLLMGCTCVKNSADAEKAKLATLQTGDCLLLQFVGGGSNIRTLVDSAGEISLPFNEKLRVAGLSLRDAQIRIQKHYDERESFIPIKVAVSRCN